MAIHAIANRAWSQSVQTTHAQSRALELLVRCSLATGPRHLALLVRAAAHSPPLSLSASLAVQSVSGFSSPSPQTRPLNVASNRSVCSSRRSFHVCKAVELAVSGLTCCCCCYSYSRLPIARRDQIYDTHTHTLLLALTPAPFSVPSFRFPPPPLFLFSSRF